MADIPFSMHGECEGVPAPSDLELEIEGWVNAANRLRHRVAELEALLNDSRDQLADLTLAIDAKDATIATLRETIGSILDHFAESEDENARLLAELNKRIERDAVQEASHFDGWRRAWPPGEWAKPPPRETAPAAAAR